MLQDWVSNMFWILSLCGTQSAFFGGAAKDLSSRIQDSCIHTTSTHHCGHCKRYQGSVDNCTSLYGTNGMSFFTPSTFREKVGHSFQLISSTTLPTVTNHSPCSSNSGHPHWSSSSNFSFPTSNNLHFASLELMCSRMRSTYSLTYRSVVSGFPCQALWHMKVSYSLQEFIGV